jgi:hypothetical protein
MPGEGPASMPAGGVGVLLPLPDRSSQSETLEPRGLLLQSLSGFASHSSGKQNLTRLYRSDFPDFRPTENSRERPEATHGTRRCGTGAMLLLLTLLATHKDAVLPEALAKCEACRVMVESVHTNVDDYLTQNENGKGRIRFRSVARSPPPPPAAAPHVAVPRVAHTSRGRVICRQRYGRRASQTAGSSHVLRHRKG